jgi:hypothetical protein
MRTRQLVAAIPPLALALLASGCADANPVQPSGTTAASLARAAGSGSHSSFTMPVSATMPAGACGLTTDVHLTGEITFNIQVTQTGTGRFIGHVNSRAIGTGAGDDGTRYRFSYSNNVRLVDFVGSPSPDNPPYTAYVIDRFQLSGMGRAPNVNSHWLFAIRLDAAGNATVLRDEQRNQECDPI